MENRKNSDRFLELFNHLENYLKNSLNDGEYRSMKQMLKMYAGSHPVLSKYRDQLFNYCDLRNAIVHNSRFGEDVIAEPHGEVVRIMAEIWNEIDKPERVSIFHKPVRTISANSSIDAALDIMREADISHIPVTENNLIAGMLTANVITRWLSQADVCNISKTAVRNVLSHAQFPNNYIFVPSHLPVNQVADTYLKSHKLPPANRYFDAILITQNGRSNEKLLGIITINDIVDFL